MLGEGEGGLASPTGESGNEPGDEGRSTEDLRWVGESGDQVCILEDHSSYAVEKRWEGPAGRQGEGSGAAVRSVDKSR